MKGCSAGSGLPLLFRFLKRMKRITGTAKLIDFGDMRNETHVMVKVELLGMPAGLGGDPNLHIMRKGETASWELPIFYP